jgi:glycine/D-amino acid oxidase-like deaminating enzyme
MQPAITMLDGPSGSVKDYRSYSFWLETVDDDLTPRPALEGSIDVDVAILGAGFSGLWTAYYLLRQDPSLRIAILEREIAGFGASGRNGGWCTSEFTVSPAALARRFGRESARELHRAMVETVDDVGRVCAEEGIDAHYARGGALEVARGPHQLPSIQEHFAMLRELDLADDVRLLDETETAERICVTKALGALFNPACAAIHPGRLVRGLARAVERRGATIYEQTEVTGYRTGHLPALRTSSGEAKGRTLVLAGEAYLTRLRPLHRQLIPMYSLIVLTEPLSESDWAQIGWRHRECVSSTRYTVDYLQRTADGRILFGSRGAPYHLGSRIEDAYDHHHPTHDMIRRLVVEWFPMLRDIRFTHSWGGPVGMPRDWMTTVSFDKRRSIATARGYTGHGVSTSNLAGRTLTDLITGTESALTSLPVVDHRSPNWEPEPLRWLSVRAMQWAYGYIDARAERTSRAPTGRSLPELLGRH